MGYIFFFSKETTSRAAEGKLCQQVAVRKSTVWFCGCFDWVDAAQTFPEPTLVGVAPAVLAHTA